MRLLKCKTMSISSARVQLFNIHFEMTVFFLSKYTFYFYCFFVDFLKKNNCTHSFSFSLIKHKWASHAPNKNLPFKLFKFKITDIHNKCTFHTPSTKKKKIISKMFIEWFNIYLLFVQVSKNPPVNVVRCVLIRCRCWAAPIFVCMFHPTGEKKS